MVNYIYTLSLTSRARHNNDMLIVPTRIVAHGSNSTFKEGTYKSQIYINTYTKYTHAVGTPESVPLLL